MSRFVRMPRVHPARRHAVPELAALGTWLRGLRRRLQHYRTRLGQQGMAAALLGLVATAFYPLWIEPSLARIDAARQRLDAPPRKPAAAAAPVQTATMDQLQAGLGSEQRFPDQMVLLMQYASENGLQLNDGAYTVTREAQGQLVRYEVSLPVHGSYPQVRRFAAAVLARERAVALLDLQFRRAKVSDPALDAVVKLAFFMRPAP